MSFRLREEIGKSIPDGHHAVTPYLNVAHRKSHFSKTALDFIVSPPGTSTAQGS
jgi:hypothetical protein